MVLGSSATQMSRAMAQQGREVFENYEGEKETHLVLGVHEVLKCTLYFPSFF